MAKHRIVVFRKYDGPQGPTCDFAYEDVWGDEVREPAEVDTGALAKIGKLGERVHGYLGGDPDGAEVFEKDVAAFSRGARMVEVWKRPTQFKPDRLNGIMIREYRYRWRASIADVLGEGD